MAIDADRISYANKCFNCSVFTYCNHKIGKFNIINLPYDIDKNKVNENVVLKSTQIIQIEKDEEDDLPF